MTVCEVEQWKSANQSWVTLRLLRSPTAGVGFSVMRPSSCRDKHDARFLFSSAHRFIPQAVHLYSFRVRGGVANANHADVKALEPFFAPDEILDQRCDLLESTPWQ
jgi:hypothetical protein